MTNLKKRFIGAIGLLLLGGLFFFDLFNGGQNFIATGLLGILGLGVLYELVAMKPKGLKAHLVTILATIIYGVAFFALYEIVTKEVSDTQFDLLIIYLLVITIATDVGAYFIGKRFGKKKFAPKISPNKTWAGFFGGLFLAGIAGLLLIIPLWFSIPQEVYGIGIKPSIFKTLFIAFSYSLILSFIAQMGDLFESYLKRVNGVKDSSNLIFGHGGILDRFDGFLFLVFVVAMWFIFVLTVFGIAG